MMKNKVLQLVFLAALGFYSVASQEIPITIVKPTPPKVAAPTPKLSELLAKNLQEKKGGVGRELREQAYAKLLEGQRYLFGASRIRSQAGFRLARQAFQKAIELDPTLSEAYTALGEILSGGEREEAVGILELGIKANPNNFGAYKLLARIYTDKYRPNAEKPDPAGAEKAISYWKEVARLDPRNPEAWAFLSEYYKLQNKTALRIDALQKWLASSQPLEGFFYRQVTGIDLNPENAKLELGEEYLKAGRNKEAVETLSAVIADMPDNPRVFQLLSQAIENVDKDTAANAIEFVQQALFSNPENEGLVGMLASLQARAGRADEAAKAIRAAVLRISEKDKKAAASLQLALGELYIEAGRYGDAATAYDGALQLREIGQADLTADEDRDFAIETLNRMIQAHKLNEDYTQAKASIDRSRIILGSNDLFPDRSLVSLYLESGKRQEALVAVRAARKRAPDEGTLIRLEAEVLSRIGKVDEGVAIIKKLFKPEGGMRAAGFDDFNNWIFISSLYSIASRGKEAIEAANLAYLAAERAEARSMAKLMLATAQQGAGDYKGAENTLREILKVTPDNPIALNNLGYFLADQNRNLNEALELIQKALKADPKNPSYLDSLGWVYFRLGKFPEAEKYLSEAARRSPSSSAIIDHLGDLYFKQGKSDLAKKMWQKALVLSSEPNEVSKIKAKLKK